VLDLDAAGRVHHSDASTVDAAQPEGNIARHAQREVRIHSVPRFVPVAPRRRRPFVAATPPSRVLAQEDAARRLPSVETHLAPGFVAVAVSARADRALGHELDGLLITAGHVDAAADVAHFKHGVRWRWRGQRSLDGLAMLDRKSRIGHRCGNEHHARHGRQPQSSVAHDSP
jgi:hypothetical protein